MSESVIWIIGVLFGFFSGWEIRKSWVYWTDAKKRVKENQ